MRAHVLLFLFLLALPAEGRAQTIGEAQIAYRQNRVPEARRIYERVLADTVASATDRVTAAQELARVHWLVEGRADPALALLDEAASLEGRPCETALLTARVLREAGRQAQAIERGRALAVRCDDPLGQDQIRLQIIDAALEQAAGDRTGRGDHLRAAAMEWDQLGLDGKASLSGARARMEIGLLAGDADQALEGWRSYFWLADQNAPQALSAYGVPALFRAGLGTAASDPARVALAELLMRAGFARALDHLVRAAGLPGGAAGLPAWRRIAAYLAQRSRLGALMLELNRGMARRGGDHAFLNQTQSRMEREGLAIQTALLTAAVGGGEAAVTRMSEDERRTALLTHYGLFGTDPGRTGGYPSLHLGHVTGDRAQRVALYGRQADVRFIELDNMISNGFRTWLWDSGSGVGGWAAGNTIIGVRPAYTGAPLLAYAQLEDGPARRELMTNQARLAAEDLERLRAAPVAYLRGLDDRLRVQALDQVAAAARARTGAGGDFRRAFLDEFYRAIWRNSFDIHETRHIIDYALAVNDGQEAVPSTGLEYRAKLSEIALSDYPRLALAGINDGTIGDSSSHGQANHRAMDLFRRWIEANPAQVAGYDPAVPALAQLDRLTDEQMRAIARSDDPLAQAAGATPPP